MLYKINIKSLLSILSMFFCSVLVSQSPKLINYQGIARTADGVAISNQSIGLRFDLHQGSPTSTVVFTEQQTIGTNTLGLFSTQIGKVNTTGLNAVNWEVGAYFLEISIDPLGGTSYTSTGTQQLAAVPYALHAESVPATFTNNVLTIGNKSFIITQTVTSTPNTSITVSGLGTVTSIGTNTFDINIPQPNFTGQGSTTVSGTYPNYTINTQTPNAPTISGLGISTVSSSGNNFTVNVATPSLTGLGTNTITGVYPNYTINSTVPSFTGAGSTTVSGSYPNYTITSPSVQSNTLIGTGLAVVSPTTGNSFTVSVPTLTYAPTTGVLSSGSNNVLVAPTLSISGNVLSSGPLSNSVTLQTTNTIVGQGIAAVSPTVGNNFTVTVAQPTFAYSQLTGSLTSGTSSANITPALTFTNNILTSGPASNSLNLSSISPWTQTGGTLVPLTFSSNVGIGNNNPFSRLDVTGTPTFAFPILKVTNTNSASLSGAIDVSSNANAAMSVVNTGTFGVGLSVNTIGPAVSVVNSGATHAIYASNTNTTALTSTAGFFDGGIWLRGKTNTASAFALLAQDVNSNNLFIVRNDGNVGISNNNPISKLDVTSSSFSLLRLATTGTNTNINFDAVPSGIGNLQISAGTSTSNGFAVNTNNLTRFNITGLGNVGVGALTPQHLLSVGNTSFDSQLFAMRVFQQTSTNANGWLGAAAFGGTTSAVAVGELSGLAVIGGHSPTLGGWADLSINPGGGNIGVGMGLLTPNAALQFGNAGPARRIVLWETANNDHQVYGFEINSNMIRYQVDAPVSDHVFYAGTSSSTSNELFRIKGNGRIGINNSTPSATLDVNGTMKLTDGSQGAGKVLTSDASGNASWASPSAPSRVRSIIIEPGMMDISAAYAVVPPSKTVIGGWQRPCVIFPDNAMSQVQLNIPIPSDWNAVSSFTVRILYGSPASSGNFDMQTLFGTINLNQSAVAPSSGGGFVLAPNATVEGLSEYVDVVPSTSSSNKVLMYTLRRNGSTGNDSSTSPMRLFGIVIDYRD